MDDGRWTTDGVDSKHINYLFIQKREKFWFSRWFFCGSCPKSKASAIKIWHFWGLIVISVRNIPWGKLIHIWIRNLTRKHSIYYSDLASTQKWITIKLLLLLNVTNCVQRFNAILASIVQFHEFTFPLCRIIEYRNCCDKKQKRGKEMKETQIVQMITGIKFYECE